ncbi:MAG TPA: 50S ribosomal protein L17 [Peptococcaceae bacterium]|nr:MAG: 50S ribosomal protein L17 [Clostridia bacterium 41_269]HBT20941.1 50S ribosomal protein L17 [Peptococcaceae bacterium]
MAYGKLSREKSHRDMMIRNMVTSFLREERISTTEAKARELKRAAEKMITLGKRGDLHARRQALAFINDEDVVKKLFDEIAPRYKDRNGGYTRVLKVGPRRGDSAPMVIVELV